MVPHSSPISLDLNCPLFLPLPMVTALSTQPCSHKSADWFCFLLLSIDFFSKSKDLGTQQEHAFLPCFYSSHTSEMYQCSVSWVIEKSLFCFFFCDDQNFQAHRRQTSKPRCYPLSCFKPSVASDGMSLLTRRKIWGFMTHWDVNDKWCCRVSNL